MDSPLQNVQDTISKNWLEESEYLLESGIQYCSLNMVPSFVHESYALYGRSYQQVFKKRPPIQFQWTSTASGSNPVFIDAISISALYGKIIAVYISGTTANIVCHNFLGNNSFLVGSFTVTGTSDFIWLSEISQASGGSTYPGFAVNYMNSAYTTSASYYAFTTSGGSGWSALTQITDTNYPNKQTPALITVGKIINFQDTFFVATLDGRIWNSPFSGRDISVWSSSSGVGSINVSAYPDQCLGIERYKQHIVAFGSNSIEFFDYDVSFPPTALARLDQVFIKFGVISPKVFANFDDKIYWIGYGANNALGLWVLDGYVPSKISNTGIEDQLSFAFQVGSNIGISCGRIRGKKTLLISNSNSRNIMQVAMLPSISSIGSAQKFTGYNSISFGSNATLALNLDDNLWWLWNFGSNLSGTSPFIVPVFNVAVAPNSVTNIQAIFLFNPGQPISPVYIQNIYALSDPFEEVSSNYWFDSFNNTPAYNAAIDVGGLYQTSISTNPVRFGNNKRKRIDQLTVTRTSYIKRKLLPAGGSTYIPDTNIYGSCLLVTREPWEVNAFDIPTNPASSTSSSIAADTLLFAFALPPASGGQARVTFNKLGSGRFWGFTYIEVSASDFVTYGYEVCVQQFQH